LRYFSIKSIFFLNALLTVFSTELAAQMPKRLTTLPPSIPEVSGMWIAAPDSIWWLNDGGNAAELYLTNHRGKLLKTLFLPLPNRDWEELTGDDQGNLYIGDFGNNQNKRRDLVIFKLHLATLKIDSISFQYPNQTSFPPTNKNDQDFDCEAMVWHKNQLHLFTKMHYSAYEFVATHYTLNDQAPTQTATIVGKINLPNQVITGADLNETNNQIALVTYLFKKLGKYYFGRSYIWIYDWNDLKNGEVTLIKKRRLRGWITSRQVESVGYFNSKTLLIASEKTPIHQAKMKRVRF
jgi:hypothetical protein